MYRKKIAAMVLFGLVMNTCATPAIGDVTLNPNETKIASVEISTISLSEQVRAQGMLEKQALIAKAVVKNTEVMQKSIKRLEYYVGKTWYAFSGSTTRGWDCSGMVKWFYKQQGVDLIHRASAQQKSGVATKNPRVGDIVVFKYNGSNSAYHVGIYIGNGDMIHSPNKGKVTRVESIQKFAGNYSKVSYRSIIKTL